MAVQRGSSFEEQECKKTGLLMKCADTLVPVLTKSKSNGITAGIVFSEDMWNWPDASMDKGACRACQVA